MKKQILDGNRRRAGKYGVSDLVLNSPRITDYSKLTMGRTVDAFGGKLSGSRL